MKCIWYMKFTSICFRQTELSADVESSSISTPFFKLRWTSFQLVVVSKYELDNDFIVDTVSRRSEWLVSGKISKVSDAPPNSTGTFGTRKSFFGESITPRPRLCPDWRKKDEIFASFSEIVTSSCSSFSPLLYLEYSWRRRAFESSNSLASFSSCFNQSSKKNRVFHSYFFENSKNVLNFLKGSNKFYDFLNFLWFSKIFLDFPVFFFILLNFLKFSRAF